jgi:hypothetical protein
MEPKGTEAWTNPSLGTKTFSQVSSFDLHRPSDEMAFPSNTTIATIPSDTTIMTTISSETGVTKEKSNRGRKPIASTVSDNVKAALSLTMAKHSVAQQNAVPMMEMWQLAMGLKPNDSNPSTSSM